MFETVSEFSILKMQNALTGLNFCLKIRFTSLVAKLQLFMCYGNLILLPFYINN